MPAAVRLCAGAEPVPADAVLFAAAHGCSGAELCRARCRPLDAPLIPDTLHNATGQRKLIA
jgi:hypothetical protein